MNMINKDEEVANKFSAPSKKLVEYITDFSDMRDEDIELTKPIYENYDEDLQVLNEANIIRTDEEIKELYNCKGEFGSTDEVTDMSF